MVFEKVRAAYGEGATPKLLNCNFKAKNWPKFDKSNKLKVVEHPQIMLGG